VAGGHRRIAVRRGEGMAEVRLLTGGMTLDDHDAFFHVAILPRWALPACAPDGDCTAFIAFQGRPATGHPSRIDRPGRFVYPSVMSTPLDRRSFLRASAALAFGSSLLLPSLAAQEAAPVIPTACRCLHSFAGPAIRIYTKDSARAGCARLGHRRSESPVPAAIHPPPQRSDRREKPPAVT
jgi:hypothetical protein